ncbi:sirohydrochlorin ferrochelatase [Halobacillus alkaliphilus]|uniref:Sirohydrochlorin ferrochelatase n=1 Tax=Halobacillus alkaliphilus TaxID=396056 RepID=A0A1I2MZI9_9BACI|nr:sirohydrochlorin chelatase [Halobacillus alkaliphilus]SFF96049.1 sirohydrochlorin ferrochelatase [Halobacillus alkaliphilus]
MQAVLYVSHGSRVEETRKEAVACIEKAQAYVNVPLWKICYLEIASPNVEDGVEELVQKGATEIAVIPVLLLSAGHYYKDLPEEISHVQQRFPSVTFTYGKPLGVQERLVDVLVDRIEAVTDRERTSLNLLLVGRGSRKPETKRDIESIAHKLKSKTHASSVDVCYLAACSPTFEEGLETSLGREGEGTVVVPYLWFTGLLIRSMQKKIEELKAEGHSIEMTHYLQDHPGIVEALADRVNEALQNKESFPVLS